MLWPSTRTLIEEASGRRPVYCVDPLFSGADSVEAENICLTTMIALLASMIATCGTCRSQCDA